MEEEAEQKKKEEENEEESGKSSQPKREKEPSVSFFKLFSYADGVDVLLLLLGSLGSITHGLAFPAFFLVFGNLVNSFGSYENDPSKAGKEVSKYAVYLVYVGLGVFFAGSAEVACWMNTGERQVTKIRTRYLEAILKQDVGFFDTDAPSGVLVESISSDTLLVQDAISEKLGNSMRHMATFIGGFVLGFISVWRLALVTLAVVPLIAFAGGLYAFTITQLTSKSQEAYGEAGTFAEQAVAQIRIVHSFVGEEKAHTSYCNALKVTLKLGYRGGLAKGTGMGATYFILFLSWALVLWYAGVLIRKGDAGGGKAITAVFSVLTGGTSLGQAFANITAYGKGRAAAYKIFDIMNREPKIDPNSGKILDEVKGDIEFRNVHFSYPSRPDVTIFKDFSLTIPFGKTVAMVGSSGSGKSTVVSLIERFYDPISGQVLVDGLDIRNLQLKWLREQIGLVNQEPALFATSILENIFYGKEGATKEEAEAAAKAANVHEFINQLPDGYQTQVGERGVQLSGGQKQRVGIARAILKNPKILLLDEATSALDAASERLVQDALDRVMVGRTTVVVAHRLSTIRYVDMIAVVQNGEIMEIGDHDELMAKGNAGLYYALVRLQEMAMASDGTILQRTSSVGGTPSMSRSKRISASGRFGSGRHSSFRKSSKLDSNVEIEMREGGDDSKAKSVFWRLAKMNAPEWPYAVPGVVAAVLTGVVTPILSFVLGEMMSVYYYRDFDRMKRIITKYVFVLIGVGVASLGSYTVEHYFFGIVGENLTNRVRQMLFASILRNEVGWFDEDENNSTRIAARLAIDAANVRAAVGDRVSLIVQNLTVFVTACIFGLVLQWRLALVLLATFPLLILAAMGEYFIMKGFSEDVAKAHAKASMVAGESVSNIRTVASFNAERKVLLLFTEELKGPQRRSVIHGLVSGFSFGFSQLAMYASYGLVLWYGGRLVENGTTPFGPVIKVFLVMSFTSFAIAEALSLTPDIIKGGNALMSLFSILDRKTLIEPDDVDAEKVTFIKGDIELRDVEFAYPSRPEVTIFKNLNLKVECGKSLALVGASGSGKSSVVALIERFYDPIAGVVLVDGKDIRKMNLRSLRQHIGLVQQEPALFAMSIYENIIYGKEGVGRSEVEEAAKAANAHSFISGLPGGYGTNVGERGVQLSGGQKQRIAIARAILKNPAILLLDEATSALDAESEKLVQKALDRLMENRTTVVVAHRLSTIRNASTIAVVQDGKIIETGRHEELINNPNGSYFRLVNIQQAHNIDAD